MLATQRIFAAQAAAALTAALFSTAVLAADGPRYTYGEIGYVNVDIDDGGDGDGWALNGSFAMTDMFHIFAGYNSADIDIDGTNFSADYTQWDVGLGVNYGISDTIDLVGRLAYVSAEVDVSGFGSADDDGYGLSAGVRAMVLPQLELNGGIQYVDLGGDNGSDTALNVGAVYNFTDMFAVSGGASFGDDVTQYGLGVRLYFGNR